MTKRPGQPRTGGSGQATQTAGGFTLVESVVSILLVATVLVAVMYNVGASKAGSYLIRERSDGTFLADSLMAEIVSRYYEEPDDPPNFGRESGESGSSRDQWDDVDDYDGWLASPAQRRDGTAITSADWSRSVTVVWVNPDDLSQISVIETEVKKITVTVKCADRVIATRTAVRTTIR